MHSGLALGMPSWKYDDTTVRMPDFRVFVHPIRLPLVSGLSSERGMSCIEGPEHSNSTHYEGLKSITLKTLYSAVCSTTSFGIFISNGKWPDPFTIVSRPRIPEP